MTDPGGPDERRREVRRAAPTERIAWAREQATRTCAGWVSNVAASSIAFVTPTRDRPRPGETIELTFSPESESPLHTRARVVRTGPHDRFFSVVACRNEPAQEQEVAQSV